MNLIHRPNPTLDARRKIGEKFKLKSVDIVEESWLKVVIKVLDLEIVVH